MNKALKQIMRLVITALMAALITVMTAFIKFNTGINNGYLHFGDSMIYLTACFLPTPYAMVAAAVGGAMADVLGGAAMWAPYSAVIKPLNALVIGLVFKTKLTKKQDKVLSVGTAVGSGVSGLITVFGYLLAESILYSFPTALTSIPFSIIQAVGSSIIFVLVGLALDKINFKTRFVKGKI